MQSILTNLHSVVKDPTLHLTSRLQVSKEKAEINDFQGLVEACNSDSNVNSIRFKLGAREYDAGRLFVRLERIAEKKYGLSIEEAHESLKPLATKLLTILQSDLPEARILPLTKDPVAGVLSASNDGFYQETQKKIMSCAIHAINNYLGAPHINTDEAEKQERLDEREVRLQYRAKGSTISADPEFDLDIIPGGLGRYSEDKLCLSVNRHFASFSFSEARQNSQFDRFFTAAGPHSFICRRDAQGQWWKVDSLHKVGPHCYQVPVDLDSEEIGINPTDTVFILLTKEQFKPYLLGKIPPAYQMLLSCKQELENSRLEFERKGFLSEDMDSIYTNIVAIFDKVNESHLLLRCYEKNAEIDLQEIIRPLVASSEEAKKKVDDWKYNVSPLSAEKIVSGIELMIEQINMLISVHSKTGHAK